MKRHNTKKLLIIIIVLFISIGFAVLTSNLNVATTLTFRENVWDIHYENLKLIDCSSDNPTLTLDNDKDEITIGNTFDIPTDYIEFSFVVLNAGTIDAVLNQINVNLTTEQQKYIEYSFKYVLDDSTVAVNDKLFAGQGKLIKARFSYKYDINEFSTLDNTSITIGFKYIQPQSSSVTTWNYEYTGTEQVFYVPKNGTYKIEAWGAQGGSVHDNLYGGYGGYSTGTISLTKNTPLYVYVGGKGNNGEKMVVIPGGYNGGGNGFYTGSLDGESNSSGGGATHVATSSGLLKDLSSDTSSIILVAGGGSGSYMDPQSIGSSVGGSGGGYIGHLPVATTNRGSSSGARYNGTASTQSAGGAYSYAYNSSIPFYSQKNLLSGSFGQGGSFTSGVHLTTDSHFSGGGGGYYGGGSGFLNAAGGGSGYIGNTNLNNKIMYCYSCQESTEEVDETHIKTRSTTNVSATATSNYAKIGNGYVKITFVS